MKAVNVDDVLKILHKYGKYIFVTDEKRYSSMADEIANLKALEQEPCEDCISRQAAINAINQNCIFENEYNLTASRIKNLIQQMPSVTQKLKMGYISIDDVMSVFDDFMCGEVDEDGTDTFLEMLKDKAESEVQK